MPRWGFGRGRGHSWSMGTSWGWEMGPNLFWNCWLFPWLLRRWWAYPSTRGMSFVPYQPYPYYGLSYLYYGRPYGMW